METAIVTRTGVEVVFEDEKHILWVLDWKLELGGGSEVVESLNSERVWTLNRTNRLSRR